MAASGRTFTFRRRFEGGYEVARPDGRLCMLVRIPDEAWVAVYDPHADHIRGALDAVLHQLEPDDTDWCQAVAAVFGGADTPP